MNWKKNIFIFSLDMSLYLDGFFSKEINWKIIAVFSLVLEAVMVITTALDFKES